MDAGKSSARTKASNVLADSRRQGQARLHALLPQQRMEMVFMMSMDALELHRAGLKAQGFSDLEIREQLRARRR